MIKEYKNIIKNLIKLSMPILGGNLATVLIGIIDTICAGRYSTQALGAISVASAIVMTFTIGAIGFILSISPVIANFRGQNLKSKGYFKLTLLFAFLISIPFFLVLELFLLKINLIGLSPDLIEGVTTYIKITAWTIFPTAIFTATKEFLQAYEKVIYANILMIVMVILNLVLNIILTFGCSFYFLQIPAMGILGLSLATLISKIVVVILIIFYCFSLFKNKMIISKKYLKDLVRVGFPISLAIFFEFLGFNLTAVLIGKFSALFAGVHNIILCLANFTFMIVLAIANAASIKIGFFNGREDKQNIIKYSKSALFLMFLVCIFMFSFLGLFSNQIISMFSNDIQVIILSKKILKFAMAFLFFDGIQGTCVGILKGLKDTKIIMFTMMFAYMAIAIPLGSFLAFQKNIVLEGFWLGLVLALMFAAIVTLSRVIFDIKRMK